MQDAMFSKSVIQHAFKVLTPLGFPKYMKPFFKESFWCFFALICSQDRLSVCAMRAVVRAVQGWCWQPRQNGDRSKLLNFCLAFLQPKPKFSPVQLTQQTKGSQSEQLQCSSACTCVSAPCWVVPNLARDCQQKFALGSVCKSCSFITSSVHPFPCCWKVITRGVWDMECFLQTKLSLVLFND